MNPTFAKFLQLSTQDRQDVFDATAEQRNTLSTYIEKDFWVCFVLDILYNGLPDGHPRLLFKGGTSLSKVHQLISRFSEDVDLVVFRDDLGFEGKNDPYQNHTLQPYIIDVLEEWNFRVDNVTSIDPQRTFWDKIMILHGWYCGYRDVQRLPSDRQRLSRHYYDVAMIYQDPLGKAAVSNVELAADVRRYTKQLFNRGWMKLDEAVPGSLKLVPEGDFRQALVRDYQAMQGMMLGDIPTFDEIVDSISALEADINSMSSNL